MSAPEQTTYRVSFEITLTSGHPRKWIPDAVFQGLEDGEDIDNWNFEEVEKEASND